MLGIFQEEGQSVDCFYCSRLLEQIGLCVCPGSDLGLPEGTHHIRYKALRKNILEALASTNTKSKTGLFFYFVYAVNYYL